jgi:hypothetical protein
MAHALDCVRAPRYVVALDPGAESAARLATNTLKGYTTAPVLTLYPVKDIKDMTIEEIKMALAMGQA